MSKIVSVVGARPNFIKIDPDLPQTIIHTGQHYNDEMSQIFFQQLGISEPKVNLNCKTVGSMIDKLFELLPLEEPDLVIVYGDANSSFAGAYVAVNSGLPVAHIESGLRSGNRKMKEENNRIAIDHLSTYRFCPTLSSLYNLEREGLYANNHLSGDVLLDRILLHKPKVIEKKDYMLLTLHRAETVDYPNKLNDIFTALESTKKKFIFPIHPRTAKNIKEFNVTIPSNIEVIQSQGYFEMIKLEVEAEKIITDSGGVQKEAYFLEVPCITLREETEWGETVSDGWNVLVGTNTEQIIDAIYNFVPVSKQTFNFGNGQAFENIRKVLEKEGYL